MADGLNFVPTSRHTHTHVVGSCEATHRCSTLCFSLFSWQTPSWLSYYYYYLRRRRFQCCRSFLSSPKPNFYSRSSHHPAAAENTDFSLLPPSSPSLVRPLHDDNAAENPGSGRRIDVVVVTVVQQTIAAQTWLLCTNDAKFLPTASPPHDYHHHHHYMKLFFRVTSTHNGICTSSSIHITIIIITFTIFRNHQRELPRRFLFYDLSRNRFYLSSLSSD